jgi:hypothetical protein
VFRGFTSTVRVFESERRGDKAAGFRVERLVDLVFEQVPTPLPHRARGRCREPNPSSHCRSPRAKGPLSSAGSAWLTAPLLLLVVEQYVPQYDAPRLLELLDFLASRFFSKLPLHGQQAASRLRESVLRYYLVYATQNGRPDKVRSSPLENPNRPLLVAGAAVQRTPHPPSGLTDPPALPRAASELTETRRAVAAPELFSRAPPTCF